MSPASFAASPSANCVGRVAVVDALDHAIEVEVGDAVGAQHLDGLLHGDAGLRRERQALEAHPGGREREQAVDELHGVAEAERAEVHERAAERLEDRLDARRRRASSPPTMNEQHAVLARPIAPPVSGASTR